MCWQGAIARCDVCDAVGVEEVRRDRQCPVHITHHPFSSSLVLSSSLLLTLLTSSLTSPTSYSSIQLSISSPSTPHRVTPHHAARVVSPVLQLGVLPVSVSSLQRLTVASATSASSRTSAAVAVMATDPRGVAPATAFEAAAASLTSTPLYAWRPWPWASAPRVTFVPLRASASPTPTHSSSRSRARRPTSPSLSSAALASLGRASTPPPTRRS